MLSRQGPVRVSRPARWAALGVVVSQLLLFGVIHAAPAMAKLPELDHFYCYPAKGEAVGEKVLLQDQFDRAAVVVAVGGPTRFCNPVTKVHDQTVTKIMDPDAHLTFYRIAPAAPTAPVSRWVSVYNQFGSQKLTTGAAVELAVPTFKMLPGHEPPKDLDHFKCYKASGKRVDETVLLKDQFLKAEVRIGTPVLFCNPTVKVHGNTTTKIGHPEAHLTCYRTLPSPQFGKVVPVANQFGKDKLALSSPHVLCVPSLKLAWGPSPVG
jgi:hypothetical protein